MNNTFWIFRFLLTVLDHTWHVECVRCIIFGFISLSTFLVLSGAIIVRKHLTVNVSSATTTFSAEMTSTGPYWKNLYLDLVVSPKLLSMEKYSLLCSPPPLYFFGWFNKKIDVLYQGCQKRFVLMYSYLYFQPIEDSIWLFLSAHPVLAMFVPSLVTRYWDYPPTLPDIPSIMNVMLGLWMWSHQIWIPISSFVSFCWWDYSHS